MTLLPGYLPANYGGVDLLIASISTKVGRDIVVQSPSRGDKHVLQDRGLRHKVSEVEILFIDQPGQVPYLVRAQGFKDAVEIDAPTSFTHPILGTYTARAVDVEMVADDEAAVRFHCRILAEDEPQITFQAGAGVSAGAGAEATSVAATNATNALTAANLSSDVPAACTSTTTAWAGAEDLDSQQVFLEVASLTAQIDSDIDTLELESDLDLWLVYQAYILLRYAVMRAAQAATVNADNVFDYLVMQARPLLAICATVYGPELAEERWSDVVDLNRIRTPGLVPAGSTLKMPSDGVLL